MSGRPIKAGSTDQSTVIRIIDSGDGTPETGVEHNTSGIDLWYRREGATKTSLTEAALGALDAAHGDGGIEHIGDGYYRLDLPDAAVAAGSVGVAIGGTVTNMIVIGTYHALVTNNPYGTIDVNVTSLSSAAITDVWSTDTLTEAYASDGAAGTSAQLLYMIWAAVHEFSISGTTITSKKLDGSTTAMTWTIDDSASPTSRTRAS